VNDYWETSKKMLSDMGFLDSLKSYDKVEIRILHFQAKKTGGMCPRTGPDTSVMVQRGLIQSNTNF
jgi:hypothetical protein